jgi:hypothetical protein
LFSFPIFIINITSGEERNLGLPNSFVSLTIKILEYQNANNHKKISNNELKIKNKPKKFTHFISSHNCAIAKCNSMIVYK